MNNDTQEIYPNLLAIIALSPSFTVKYAVMHNDTQKR